MDLDEIIKKWYLRDYQLNFKGGLDKNVESEFERICRNT